MIKSHEEAKKKMSENRKRSEKRKTKETRLRIKESIQAKNIERKFGCMSKKSIYLKNICLS